MIAAVSLGTVAAQPDFATRLVALREALDKMTQEQLAERTGGRWTRPYIANIENGKNQLGSYEARAILAAALGVGVVDMAEFIDGRGSVEEFAALVRSEPLRSTRHDPGENRRYPASALGNRAEWPDLKKQLESGKRNVNPHLVEEVAHAQFSNAPAEPVTLAFVFKQYEAAEEMYGDDYEGPEPKPKR